MDGTILGQGTFTASSYALTNPNAGFASVGTANPQVILVPSGADWVKVYNFTRAGANGTNAAYFLGTNNAFVGTEFYWQRGMAPGTAFVKYKSNAASTLNQDTLVTGGFTIYDPSAQTPGSQPRLGPAVATTASTNVTRPVVSTGDTTGISVGTVVRMSNTAQTDVNGIDMVVGAVTLNTSFTLLTATNALATAPGAIGGAGFYRIVRYDEKFYPDHRYITNITQATNAQVSTSIEHSLTAGQAIRFNIPAASGMTQLNGTPSNNYFPQGTSNYATVVTVVDAYNFTINVDTTGYSAFTWPTIAQQPTGFPILIPVGQNTAATLLSTQPQVPLYQGQQVFNSNSGILADSTVDTDALGMVLGSGGNGLALTTPILGPSGSISWSAGNVATGDTIYWVAGKSTFGGL